MHQVGKTRSRTGCRTCRIRKVKCDEEKHGVQGLDEPQCKRCKSARIRCEWKGGPIPRKPSCTSSSNPKAPHHKTHQLKRNTNSRLGWKYSSLASFYMHEEQQPSSPLQSIDPFELNASLQAANPLNLTVIDRECIDYLQSSTLVIILGKHWPWSTVSYAYHKIAVAQPMVMSMMLASTAREIYRSRLHDTQCYLGDSTTHEAFEISGQAHYGRALASLRRALKADAKSPQDIEAIFITLWLMIDYENRFGSGESAINIHIRGIETMLHSHVVPQLQHAVCDQPSSPKALPTSTTTQIQDLSIQGSTSTNHVTSKGRSPTNTRDVSTTKTSPDGLGSTSVPLFLLWTLYFFTPAALAFGFGTTRVDTDIFRFFLGAENRGDGHLTLPELYRISRQSASRFWGEGYPLSAQLDDLENLPGLTLYHQSHVIQFKITELFNLGPTVDRDIQGLPQHVQHRSLMNEINSLTTEYDTLLKTAHLASSCDAIGDGRRVLETVYWASITFYSMIIYFHLCSLDSGLSDSNIEQYHNIIGLQSAVSHVLDLSLKVYRSRPRLIARITWPLFIAGIATTDKIYQDWVSIRLNELGRYGQNYARISERFDEIIRQGSACIYNALSLMFNY